MIIKHKLDNIKGLNLQLLLVVKPLEDLNRREFLMLCKYMFNSFARLDHLCLLNNELRS